MTDFKMQGAERVLKVAEILDSEDSYLLSILRWHFYIEIELKELLHQLVRTPTVLLRKNAPTINFHNRVYLVESMIPSYEVHTWLWEALRLANTVRNKMAHHLESNKLDSSVDKMIEYIKENHEPFRTRVSNYDCDKKEQCIYALSLLHQVLSARTASIKKNKL